MIKGLLFDLNGTIIDICTNESDFNVWKITAAFMNYCGVFVEPPELRDKYFELNRRQRNESFEEYPEFDSGRIFNDIIKARCGFEDRSLGNMCSRVFRAASRYRLELYDGVRETLEKLSATCKMAALSDGQSLWAVPELRAVGAAGFFSFVMVSGDYGYRKPDSRLFAGAVKKMALPAEDIVFVGNDMYRDVYGAKNAGLKCIFFKSNQGEQKFCGREPDYIIYNFRQLVEAVDFLSECSRT